MKGSFEFPTFQDSLNVDFALACELKSIKPEGLPNSYYSFFTWMVDNVYQSRLTPEVTLYEVRVKHTKKTVLLQSNWVGMEFFKLTK